MFTGTIGISSQDVREVSSVQQMFLGTKAVTRDGRVYRYAKAGASALTVGTMNQQSATVANHTNQAVAVAAAVGATEVSVTLGATAATKDQYAEGYLLINDAAGEGIVYNVSGHAAIGSAGTGVINLAEPIKVALTTASEYTLIANPFKDVVIVPQAATSSGNPAGVANVAVTEAYFGWLQTGGVCAMLASSTPFTLGEEVSQSNNEVAGAGGIQIATAPNYGVAMQLGVATEYQTVYLTIDS